MLWQELGIEYKQVAETLVATVRINLESRQDLPTILDGLARRIPRDKITGPPFCIIQFITSIEEGSDAEVGFPVRSAVDADGVTMRTFPSLGVLSLVHTGPLEALSESYATLYGAAAEQGLISDEFVREVYPDWELAGWDRVEVQFVLHNWSELFAANLARVLGEEVAKRIRQGWEEPGVASILDKRFRWVKGMLERLDGQVSEDQIYDILSRCAHVFPQEQIDKLRTVYEDTRAESDDPLDAVDAVIAFMGDDPGWGRAPTREGSILYSTKAPRDVRAYENAQSEAERRSAYCFCPIVRSRLERGMPPAFCYCGAGWYRQQWEGAIGRAVNIRIVKSILKGDNECQFAIHLPDDADDLPEG